MDRQGGERDEAADKARRDERAVARGSQRIKPRRRMHQRVDKCADLREQAHVTPDTPVGRAPQVAGVCRSPLKRTLSGAALNAFAAPYSRATALARSNSSRMVNDL